MIQEVLSDLIPNDPASVARCITAGVACSLTIAADRYRLRKAIALHHSPTTKLADRIRARMAEEPDIVHMDDALLERVAGVLSPVPPAESVPAVVPINL